MEQSSLLSDLKKFNATQELFQKNTNGRYFGSKPQLRAERKILQHLLAKHKNANSMEDVMMKENMKAAIKQANRQITPNPVKRAAKSLARWTGGLLEKAAKWTWKNTKNLLAGPYEGKTAQNTFVQTSGKLKAGTRVHDRAMSRGKKANQQPTNWLNVDGLRHKGQAKPVKLDRSLSNKVVRKQVPAQEKKNGVHI